MNTENKELRGSRLINSLRQFLGDLYEDFNDTSKESIEIFMSERLLIKFHKELEKDLLSLGLSIVRDESLDVKDDMMIVSPDFPMRTFKLSHNGE